MKKCLFILMQIFIMIAWIPKVYSQADISVRSYAGMFDKGYDRFGNEYSLAELNMASKKPIGGHASVNAAPSQSCSSGYFALYFGPGTFFDNNITAQNALCRVFADLSTLINSPLSITGQKVNIYCGNIPLGSGAGGTASSIYMFPQNATNPNQGFIYDQVQKTILSGVDSYSNLPISIFSGANNFYHGYMGANPNYNWNLTYTTSAIGSNQYDFYSIMLHEAMHLLGFYTNIGPNGTSLLGAANNYYSVFDKFLVSASNVPLLTTTASCISSGLTFTGSATQVNPGLCQAGSSGVASCGAGIKYASSSQTVAVYTPTCYISGSSLSHFEDVCSHPSGTTTCTGNPAIWNDRYFVMSNSGSTGSCFIKRYPREEERQVLCDLGYSVNTSYTSFGGSPAAMIDGTLSSHSYTAGACSGPGIWGINDGVVGGVFTFTAASSATNAIAIPIAASITINDASSTTQISCLNVIYNNATAAVSNGSLVVTTALNFSGLVIVKYLPDDGAGHYGNPTYVFVYFLPQGCTPNGCDLVSNGGFEINNSATGCGGLFANPNPSNLLPRLDCWEAQDGTPDYYARGCTLWAGFNDLGNTNFGGWWASPFDSYNSAPNNGVMGFGGLVNGGVPLESLKANLSAPLIPNQAYQMELWAFNPSPSVTNGHNVIPLVLSVNSMPNFASLAATNTLASFTVNPTQTWTHLTATFTFAPATNHQAIVVGVDNQATSSLNNLATSAALIYMFVDDISIKPAPTTTFIIPGATACGNATFTNLAQYASQIPGVFTGTGVTSSTTGTLTQYHFNVTGTLTPGNYPVAFTYTNPGGCVSKIWQSIIIQPTVDIGFTGSTIVCSNSTVNTTVLNATSSCTSCTSNFFYWQPGYLSGATQTLAPGSYTVYATLNGCTTSNSIAVVISNSCCTNTVPAVPGSTLGAINGPLAFNSNFTVVPGGSANLIGEFMFAPSTKITVSNGAVLTINGAHLYACSGDMWDGIEVLDGGKIVTTFGSLIEDAVTAISANNHATTPMPLIMEITGTTFNKNYIDISASNYNQVNTKLFDIKQSVFTCRDLAFTSNAWPTTATSASVSTSGAELRHAFANTPTTGLTPPYLNQSTFTVTNLKNPYATQRSHIAIKLNNVGIVNSTTRFAAVIGSTANVGDYNVFDAHGQFISAANSNVISLNNVFQNTQTYTTVAGNFGGAAISHSTGSTMNTELIMTANNKSLGSRFWNCHKGVEGRNIYLLDVQNATFRSTQSSNTPSFTSKGIEINTNRFDYYIAENEFTNQHTGINIPLAPGQFMPTGTSFTTSTGGLYADKLRITENAFTGTVSPYTNSYMEWAVNVSGPFLNAWNVIPNVGTSPAVHALAMTINTVTNARNGLAANGIRTLPTINSDNVVTLLEGSGAPQYGMVLVNANPTNFGNIFWSKPGENAITNNTVSFASTPTITNLPGALVYCDYIGYAAQSPSVTCNDLSKGVNGFLYSGPSPGTIWAGNKMSTLERGLVLSNSGVIGVQGGSMTAISNLWDGSWANKSHTYVDGSSDAINSKLYVTNSPGLIPTNNGGLILAQNFSVGTSYTTTATGAGAYNCYNMPNYKTISVPNNDSEFLSPTMFYMQEMAFYNLVHINDSLRFSDGEFEEFHDSKAEGSIGKFVAADEFLYSGDYNEALSALSEIGDDLNTVELNYLQFYTLYATYLEKGSLSEQEAGELNDLAWLCPGTNGSAVFQARALYNTLYHEIISTACDEDFGDRKAIIDGIHGIANARWNLKLFPNPTEKTLNIHSSTENEFLKIKILDLSGRLVYEQDVKATGFLTKLELNLVNGAYFIHVQNQENRELVQKLLIAK